MDLGIAGRSALVCASSKGLGKACAKSLAEAGVHVVINGRDGRQLDATAAEFADLGIRVTPVVADVATAEGRSHLIAQAGQPDILVTNAGGPPAGDFRAWSEADWHGALELNMVAPIMLIRALIDPMIARGFGRIINITSGAVKAPIETLGMSNGARSGLTGFVSGLARQVARHGVTVNNLLPGPFETDRLTATLDAAAKAQNVDIDTARARRLLANPSRRFGRPEEFGAACAFLASTHAGYITAQNILLDGGSYPGTF